MAHLILELVDHSNLFKLQRAVLLVGNLSGAFSSLTNPTVRLIHRRVIIKKTYTCEFTGRVFFRDPVIVAECVTI